MKKTLFFEFLDVSLAPWVEITKSTSKSESETLLIWIARNLEISEAIVDAYHNYEREFDLYEGVQNLFEDIGSGKDADGKVEDCDRTIMGSSKKFKDIFKEIKNCDAMKIYIEVCADNEDLSCGSSS